MHFIQVFIEFCVLNALYQFIVTYLFTTTSAYSHGKVIVAKLRSDKS
jgi:hypothetical protein